jgi:hypothetical protein
MGMKNMRLFLFIIFTFVCLPFVCAEGLPYEIPPGDYYVWDNYVNIHENPSYNAEITGRLDRNDMFSVLYTYWRGSDKYASIERDSGYQWWYRIETENGLEGYVNGQYIAIKRRAVDIDENGMMDYFYITYGVWGYYDGYSQDHEDVSIHNTNILIYINNKKIDDNIFNQAWRNMRGDNNFWNGAEFTEIQYIDGKITLGINFLVKDSRSQRVHYETVTFDLTEGIILSVKSNKAEEDELYAEYASYLMENAYETKKEDNRNETNYVEPDAPSFEGEKYEETPKKPRVPLHIPLNCTVILAAIIAVIILKKRRNKERSSKPPS